MKLHQLSPITLLSEHQIREHGLVIDSVAKKHKSAYGKQGTQCFHISQDLHIDFEDRGGLMGFEILPIEDGDEEIFEIFTITTPVRWTSQRFVHDPIQATSSDIEEVPIITYTVHTDIPADTTPKHQEPEQEHTHQEDSQEKPQPPTFDLVKFDIVHPNGTMMET